MVTFFVCLVLLIVGFFTYSKLVEKIFRIDDRPRWFPGGGGLHEFAFERRIPHGRDRQALHLVSKQRM